MTARLNIPLASLLSLLLCACPKGDEDPPEPPLRPLVYTESPSQEPVPPVPGYEMWTGDVDPVAYPDEPPVLAPPRMTDRILPDQVDLSTPDALGRAVFAALTHYDAALLDHLILTPADYAAVARTSLERGEAHISEVRADSAALLAMLRGEVPSEQRPGGVGGLLELESVNFGSYRFVSGEAVPAGEAGGEMVLGTEVVMRLRGTSQLFRLRLPKVLLGPSGQWRLAEPPETDAEMDLYLDMGFHLSPTLLAFEHYPLPLHTGNFWSYRVREVVDERIAGSALAGRESAEGSGDEETDWPTFRDEVIDREEYDGYVLVRLRRTWDDADRRTEHEALLLTPRRVYRCNSDCRRHVEDVSTLLNLLSRRTPDLVFPLEPGMGWRSGGRLDPQGEYQTRSEPELAEVPAGRFVDTICVTRSTVEGREHRYVAPGIGVVLTRIDGARSTTYHELVGYRIIP